MQIMLWTLLTIKKVPFRQEGSVNFWITDTDFSILDTETEQRYASLQVFLIRKGMFDLGKKPLCFPFIFFCLWSLRKPILYECVSSY